MNNKKLSTESYKGVRDFYPEDQQVLNYIFGVWRKVAEGYGYEEYNASILEPTELYTSKTSDEIVNEQTYTFMDRGDRSVTLRPEMTPTLARMIEGRKRELSWPLRWYSVPNCFRYERTQRGRDREFWQFNADVFGSESPHADAEAVGLAYDILKAFGAKDSDFEIRINTRKLFAALFDGYNVPEEKRKAVMRLIDRKDKMPAADFEKEMNDLLGASAEKFMKVLSAERLDEPRLTVGQVSDERSRESSWVRELSELLTLLEERGIANARFTPSLMRGFDYYTGTIFEFFDTDPKNNRSLFGGGRYDRLLEIFNGEPIPAVGFAIGDSPMRNFLESHNLLPDFASPTHLYIATVEPQFIGEAHALANRLRERGVNVAVNLLDKKLADQIKTADKKHIPFVLALGKEEIESKKYKLKNLNTGEETICRESDIATLCAQ